MISTTKPATTSPTSTSDFPLMARASQSSRSVIEIGDRPFGGEHFAVIAGPCAVESQELISTAAKTVSNLGAAVLRGGAFKPRTSPYSFQGLGMDAIAMLKHASELANIPFVTEVLDPRLVDELAAHVDAFQIGTRNMHNFALLEAVGRSDRPVLLKRGFGATLKEWILAAEYIARQGNDRIILCERGIRTFDDQLRYTLDLAGAMWARHETHLPVIIDPSHAIGLPHLLTGAACAAAAAGLDGLMIEVHPRPDDARCDADQALTPADFEALIARLAPIASAAGRPLLRPEK